MLKLADIALYLWYRYVRRPHYPDYIRSTYWKRKASRLRKEAGLLCQVCGRKGELHVHHRNYNQLGWEGRYDLIVVCKRCHIHIHRYLF